MNSQNIILRAPEPSDLEMMYRFENNSEVWLYSETSKPYSKFTIEEYLKTAHEDIYSARQLRFVIDKKEMEAKNKAIGFVDLYDFDPLHRRAGVGVLIGDFYERKKGYAFETIEIVKKYAFETIHLHQLYCYIEESNQSSINLFVKCGFKQTAVFKDWLFSKGTWQSVILMQYFSPYQ